MAKLKPMNGYIVLRPIEEEEEMHGNIVIPDLGKERPELGEVVAVSSTFNWHTGTNVESNLSVGNVVLIPKLGATRISVKGEEYFICKEQDIYSVLIDDAVVETFLETKVGDIDEKHYFVADINKVNEVINETTN